MPVKKDILDSIAAMARRMGRAPSLSEFVARAGISEYFVSQCFPSWSDAVRTAGLEPNTSNVRLEDCELLKDWGETVRKNRAIPSRRAYQREGQYDIRTIERRFGPWSSIPETFRKFAQDKPEGQISRRYFLTLSQRRSADERRKTLSRFCRARCDTRR